MGNYCPQGTLAKVVRTANRAETLSSASKATRLLLTDFPQIRNAVEEQRLIMQARFTRLMAQVAPGPPLPATGGGRGDTGRQAQTSRRPRL